MSRKSRRGFTLIELMIVIAIFAIIAALAIPNILQGRILYNEATAIGSLQQYVTAQEVWRKSFFASIEGNNYDYSSSDDDELKALNSGQRAFADNYRNLYYGIPRKDSKLAIKLVSKPMADAFYPGAALATSAPVSTESGETPATVSAPLDGYLFAEDPFMITGSVPGENDDNGWNTGYGLVAYPTVYGRNGNNIFWVGFNRKIMMAAPSDAATGTRPDVIEAAESPFCSEPTLKWAVR